MTRKMLVVIAAVFTPFLMGQMCGTVNPVESNRLEVTDELRTACEGYLTDDEIETMLLKTNDWRAEGFEEHDVLAAARTNCMTQQQCNCGVAITRQVYGQ